LILLSGDDIAIMQASSKSVPMLLFLYITIRLSLMFFYANVPDNDAKKIIADKHLSKVTGHKKYVPVNTLTL
jgi:hypothetical protein